MRIIAHKFTDYLIRKNVVDAEKGCIYEYGFQIGLEVCLNTIISIFIAIVCDMELETIVFFYVFTTLRSYAGGLHLNSYSSCMLCSCLSLYVMLLIVKYIDYKTLYCLVIEFISLFLIKVLSPVQDINRPIEQKEMVQFAKKLNFSIVKISVVSIVFCFLQFNSLLQMISVTTFFMLCILVLGKIRYKRVVRDRQQYK